MKPSAIPPSGAAARCPHLLLDTVLDRMGLRNDACLARALAVSPPSISKVRRRRVALSAELILRIHEVVGLPVGELRILLAGTAAQGAGGRAARAVTCA